MTPTSRWCYAFRRDFTSAIRPPPARSSKTATQTRNELSNPVSASLPVLTTGTLDGVVLGVSLVGVGDGLDGGASGGLLSGGCGAGLCGGEVSDGGHGSVGRPGWLVGIGFEGLLGCGGGGGWVGHGPSPAVHAKSPGHDGE